MSGKTLKFRNYRPADASLAANVVSDKDKPTTDSLATDTPANGSADRGKKKQQQQEQQPPAGGARKKQEEEDVIKKELEKHMEEHGSEQLNVAPRKPNWDLKRDVAKKVEKLNRMTQKAIVDLLREKLAKEAEEGSDEEDSDSDEE